MSEVRMIASLICLKCNGERGINVQSVDIKIITKEEPDVA